MTTHRTQKRIVLAVGAACVDAAGARRGAAADARAVGRRRRALQDHRGRARPVQDGDPAAARRQGQRRRRRRRCCRTTWRCRASSRCSIRRRSSPTCSAEQLTINPPTGSNVGAEGVIKARATAYGSDVKLEFRLFEVGQGRRAGAVQGLSRPDGAGAAAGAPVRQRGRQVLHRRGRLLRLADRLRRRHRPQAARHHASWTGTAPACSR